MNVDAEFATSKVFHRSSATLLLLARSLLFFSCVSFSDSFSYENHWSDDTRYSSLENPLQSQCENLRQTWLRLAPTDWQDRLRGFQVSPLQEDMDLLFFSEEQWIWVFSQDMCSNDTAVGELQVLILFGRMLALNGRSLSLLYLYPPKEDIAIQDSYLQEDLAHLSYGSFMLFRPYQGLSLIPLKESMIARYAQQFWSTQNSRQVYNYHWQALSKEAVNKALFKEFDNPIDEFVLLWLALVYQVPVPASLSNKFIFLKKEEPLSQLAVDVRQRMLS